MRSIKWFIATIWLLAVCKLATAQTSNTGNVGIGTTSPAAKLQINHSSTPGRPSIAILDSLTGSGPSIQFRRLGLDSAFSITGVPDGSESRRGLIMSWIDDSLLWLKPNGALGLGTNMPMARMQVNHKSSKTIPTLSILDSAGGAGSSIQFRRLGLDSAFSITGVPDGSESRRGLILGWRDDSLLWLKPNGALGLGTNMPMARMQVNHKSSKTIPTLSILDSAGGAGSSIQFRRLGLDSAFSITGVPDGSESRRGLILGWRDDSLLWLKPNGALGLGTNMPMARMQVNHKSSKTIPTLSILDSAGGAGSSIQFRRLGLDSAFSITGVPDGSESRRGLILGWRDDSLLWLKPNGALGLGTNMPMARMQVNHKSTPNAPSLLILDSAGGNGATLSLGKENMNNRFNLRGMGGNSPSTSYFSISGGQSGDPLPTESISFNFRGDGRVGLGIANPLARLQINHKSASGSPSLLLLDSAGGAGSTITLGNVGANRRFDLKSTISGSNASSFFDVFVADDIFYTGGGNGPLSSHSDAPLIRIAGNGRVGINTFAPMAGLQVNYRSALGEPAFLLLDSANGTGNMLSLRKEGVNRSFNIGTTLSEGGSNSLSFLHTVRGGSNAFLHYNANSNRVGINTINPQATLDIGGSLRIIGVLIAGATAGQPGEVLTSQGVNLPPIWQNLNNKNPELTRFNAFKSAAESVPTGSSGTVISLNATERFDIGNKFTPATGLYQCLDSAYQFNARVTINASTTDNQPYVAKLTLELLGLDDISVVSTVEESVLIPAGVPNGTPISLSLHSLQKMVMGQKVRLRFSHTRSSSVLVRLEEFSGFNM